MAEDPYSPHALLALLPRLLPSGLTQLTSPLEALAALVHAIHINTGFRLEPPATREGNASVQEASRLPDGWGERSGLGLAYKHERSAMSFEVNISKLGSRAVVNAIAVQDDRTKTFDFVIADYFSNSAFPLVLGDSPNLESMFSSPARLKDLIGLYKTSVIQTLAPGLFKGETSSSSQPAPQADVQDRRARGYYPDPTGPILPGPVRPQIPQSGPSRQGPFADIGRSDLLPLGGMGGTTGTGRLFGDLEGTGMMMGPNHPLFRDRFQNQGPSNRTPQGPWGGDGFLPQGAVPPGARFDPVGPVVGPGGALPFNQGGLRGFGGTRQPPGFRGDPDNDEFLPPRNNDYDSMFG